MREFAEAYGLEKSAISEHFIEANRAKLKDMMERRLYKMRLCELLIDATSFAGQEMVGELLGDLMDRGLQFAELRVYVLDGGKAFHAAVKKYAGESAPIQRCQVH